MTVDFLLTSTIAKSTQLLRRKHCTFVDHAIKCDNENEVWYNPTEKVQHNGNYVCDIFDSRHWESYQRENSIDNQPLQFTCKVLQTKCGNVLDHFTLGEGVEIDGCHPYGCDVKCANGLCPFLGHLSIENLYCNMNDKTWSLVDRLGTTTLTCGTCQTESQKSDETTTLSPTMSTTIAELPATATDEFMELMEFEEFEATTMPSASEGFCGNVHVTTSFMFGEGVEVNECSKAGCSFKCLSDSQCPSPERVRCIENSWERKVFGIRCVDCIDESHNTDSVIVSTTAAPSSNAPNAELPETTPVASTTKSQNEELNTMPSSTTIESPDGQQGQTTISNQNVEDNIESTTSESGCPVGWELTDHGIFKFRK